MPYHRPPVAVASVPAPGWVLRAVLEPNSGVGATGGVARGRVHPGRTEARAPRISHSQRRPAAVARLLGLGMLEHGPLGSPCNEQWSAALPIPSPAGFFPDLLQDGEGWLRAPPGAAVMLSRPCIAPCSDNQELRAVPRGDSLDHFTAW